MTKTTSRYHRTTAEAIAEALGHDGTCFVNRYGGTLDEQIELLYATVIRRGDGSGDYKALFQDGSVITVSGVAWDLGYPHCWCWRGNGHEDCTAGATDY